MAIYAESSGGSQRELIPAGNYVARCYQMLHIGTVEETILGETKKLNKVRIGFELPGELRVFKEENGEQPIVISKEFTLSMHEKSSLRQVLKSWRGKDFTEDEAKKFDIVKLLGVPCMLNIIHKPSKKDTSKVYEEISSITPLPKGFTCPLQINSDQELNYDNFNQTLFDGLPDFLKNKIKSSDEYRAMINPHEREINNQVPAGADDDQDTSDLPF